jgi:hypothetical protein
MKEHNENLKFILNTITDAYIFIMFLIFPFIVDKTGFFHIMEIKWHSFLIISISYIVISTFILLIYKLFFKLKLFKIYKLSLVQYLALAFLLVNVISTFTSPYFSRYNLYVGIGRGEGLLVTSLYVLSFLYVSLFTKFDKKHILYIIISSIIHSSICILQYIGFNPFNMYQGSIGTHNVSFMGTIGNVDFISAYYCIVLTISFAAFVFIEKEENWKKILELISILFGFFIIGIISVQSGKVAFFGTLVLFFPFILKNNKRLSKFMIGIAAILFGYCFNIIINPEYHYDVQRLGFYFQFNKYVVAFIFVIIILIALAKRIDELKYDINNIKLFKLYYIGIFACAFIGLLFLGLVDIHLGFLHEIHEMLHGHFLDEYGTYRVFLWKRTIKLIPDYPLIGSGPDTFAVRFMSVYANDVRSLGAYTINDTAANVYLTMLVNIGIIGLWSYILFLFVLIKTSLKNMNIYSFVLLLGIVCFLIQDFFNLWLVIVTPLFWILLALFYNCYCNGTK